MKQLLLLLFFFLFINSSTGQNLVLDPSFEQSSYPPSTTWKLYIGTVDLFDNRGSEYIQRHQLHKEPSTFSPYSGNRCMGGFFVKNQGELFYGSLLEPLKNGQVYDVSMFVKLDKVYSYPMEEIPVYFSTKAPKGNLGNVEYTSLRGSEKLIKNHYWTRISGTYRAKGGEQFITIGNFKNSNFKQRHGNSNAGSGYYVMDDVSVVPVKEQATISKKNNNNNVVSISPPIFEKFYKKEPIELYFNNNSTDITQTYLNELKQQLSFLVSNSTVCLKIEGHTDNVGNHKSNNILSERRAEKVAQFFIQNGIKANRLTTKGHGSSQPIAANTSEIGRQKNRRVSIHFELTPLNDIQKEALRDFAKLYGYIRYFHPSTESQQIDWNDFAAYGVHELRKVTTISAALETLKQLFLPIAPSVQICDATPCTASVVKTLEKSKFQTKYWEYFGLGGGNPVYEHQLVTKETKEKLFDNFPKQRSITASLVLGKHWDIPIVLPDLESKTKTKKGILYRKKINVTQVFKEDMYIANSIILWNIIQHFYPYHEEINLDWESALIQILSEAVTIQSDQQFDCFIKKCSEKIKDGHSFVSHKSEGKMMTLPFELTLADNEIIVSRTGIKNIKVGDKILSIDGQKAQKHFNTLKKLISGSESWKKWNALERFGTGKQYSIADIELERSGKIHPVSVKRDWPKYKNNYCQKLDDDVYYIDLTQIYEVDTLLKKIDELNAAKGIIFDIRGYLTFEHTKLLSHFITQKDTVCNWIKTPKIILPNQAENNYEEIGWKLEIEKPTIQVPMIFLTNGKAISASESFLLFIKHYQIGKIIGEPTAGANGSRNWQELLGDYSFHWTGEIVKKFDGSNFHNIGVIPDILLYPKASDWIQSKDTLLTYAINEFK